MISKRSRAIAVLVLFLLPFILAGWLYQHAARFHFKTSNLGHLLIQPVQIKGPWQKELGQWQILYWPKQAALQNNEQANRVLYELHQLRTVLGKNAKDLPLTIILPSDCAKTACAQLAFQKAQDLDKMNAVSSDFLAQISQADRAAGLANPQGNIYLIDPQGYFFMYYSDKEDPRNILQDLQHLLEVSSAKST